MCWMISHGNVLLGGRIYINVYTILLYKNHPDDIPQSQNGSKCLYLYKAKLEYLSIWVLYHWRRGVSLLKLFILILVNLQPTECGKKLRPIQQSHWNRIENFDPTTIQHFLRYYYNRNFSQLQKSKEKERKNTSVRTQNDEFTADNICTWKIAGYSEMETSWKQINLT